MLLFFLPLCLDILRVFYPLFLYLLLLHVFQMSATNTYVYEILDLVFETYNRVFGMSACRRIGKSVNQKIGIIRDVHLRLRLLENLPMSCPHDRCERWSSWVAETKELWPGDKVVVALDF